MEQGIRKIDSAEPSSSAPLVVIAQLRRQLADLMRIDEHEIVRPPDAVIALRGQVYGDTETAFKRMTQRFATYGYTVSLRSLACSSSGPDTRSRTLACSRTPTAQTR
jgi:hypothetical protein